jgi:hypothetical protein
MWLPTARQRPYIESSRLSILASGSLPHFDGRPAEAAVWCLELVIRTTQDIKNVPQMFEVGDKSVMLQIIGVARLYRMQLIHGGDSIRAPAVAQRTIATVINRII